MRSGDRIPVVARFSAHVQTGPGAHPVSCTMGIVSFSEVKSGHGVTLTPHPLLVPLVMKGLSYSTPPMGRTTCTEAQCLYKGCTLPLPLKPLTAVRRHTETQKDTNFKTAAAAAAAATAATVWSVTRNRTVWRLF